MKKTLLLLGLVLFIPTFYSCEDVLDRKPLDKISDSDVWESPSLLEGYVLDLYARMPHGAWATEYLLTDEATFSSSNENPLTRGTMDKNNTVGTLEYWDYSNIRACNEFLEKIAGTPATDEQKAKLEGEVRALRAFAYFEMAKRYGGIPLITTVIDPYGEIKDEYKKRAKEEEIHDFVDSEYTIAIQLLEKTSKVKPTARINKWTALALKARANLYAASIAKYGTVQLNGLVGISSSRANEFFKKASDAASQVINSGLYSLYNKYSDKAKNYQYIFLEEGNNEILFAKEYNGSEVRHSWDHWMAPNNFASGQGSDCNPVLDLILSYENTDGTEEDYTQYFNKDHLFSDALDLFRRKDPRLFGTVLMQGSKFQNYTMQFYDGIDTGIVANTANIVKSPTLTYKGYTQVGLDSRMTIGDDRNTNSGFLIRKWCDEPKLPIAVGTSQVDWPIIRLAEVYLTRAEAEYELGGAGIQTALGLLNSVRQRAGISVLNESTINMQKIQNEWLVEFAFENKRFFDLRRWRIAESVLNTTIKGLSPIWHFASNKFYFLPINAETFNRTYPQRQNYNPISTSRINNNPKLEQNPSY